MAYRSSRGMSANEVMELVMQEGSEDEDDVVRGFVDEREVEDLEFDNDYVPDVDSRMGESSDEDDSSTPSRATPTSEARSRPRPTSASGASSMSTSASSSRSTTPRSTPVLPAAPLDLDLDDSEWMFDWGLDLTNFPVIPPFTGTPGFTFNVDPEAKPVDFYRLFVTDDQIKNMRLETNRYARQAIAEKVAAANAEGREISPRSYFSTWAPVTDAELKKFLGLIIHMGIDPKPAIVDYWSRHPALGSNLARATMPRERFRSILAFFHLNNNATAIPKGTNGHDPLHKLRPFYDGLVEKFKTLYIPEKNICVDKAMCPWRGRCSFIVYMKDKPVKWGIKMYQLCESESGYVWNMETWCNSPNLSNKPRDVVHRLVEDLKGRGHCLYFDNYYCAPDLCEELVAEDVSVVGTVRSNRVGLPKELFQGAFAAGQMDYRRKNQLVVLRWKDKRDVQVLSSVHVPAMQNWRSRRTGQEMLKPSYVVDYTKYMGGVDHSDQMLSYVPFHRKTIKWWKKLAFHLLTLCMTQAHCLYNKARRANGRRPIALKKFALEVCSSLAAFSDEDFVPPQPGPEGDVARLRGRHFPERIPAPGGREGRMQKSCHVCYKRMAGNGASREELRNKAKRTQFQCADCPSHVPLCVDPCFRIFHTMQNY